MTMNTFCQSPVTTNTQVDNGNTIFTSERRNNSDMLAEMLKVLTLDSTIDTSAYYNSDEDDAEGDPKSDPLVATHTSEGKKEKSLILTLPTEIFHKNIDQPDPPDDHFAD